MMYFHSPCFSASCLAIGKNRPVEAWNNSYIDEKHTFDNRGGDLLINGELLCVGTENSIKSKRIFILISTDLHLGVEYINSDLFVSMDNALLALVGDLDFVEGSEPAHNSDGIAHCYDFWIFLY